MSGVGGARLESRTVDVRTLRAAALARSSLPAPQGVPGRVGAARCAVANPNQGCLSLREGGCQLGEQDLAEAREEGGGWPADGTAPRVGWCFLGFQGYHTSEGCWRGSQRSWHTVASGRRHLGRPGPPAGCACEAVAIIKASGEAPRRTPGPPVPTQEVPRTSTTSAVREPVGSPLLLRTGSFLSLLYQLTVSSR